MAMGHKPPLDGPAPTSEQELESDEAGRILTDKIYAVLADHPRRLILHYLRDSPENMASRQQISEHISEHDLGPQRAETVAIKLHHVHLPKLTEAGIVEYNPQTGIIQYTPRPIVETHLNYVDGWS